VLNAAQVALGPELGLGLAVGAQRVWIVEQRCERFVPASVVDGALVARLLSPSPPLLRGALIAAMRALRGRELPRLWS